MVERCEWSSGLAEEITISLRDFQNSNKLDLITF